MRFLQLDSNKRIKRHSFNQTEGLKVLFVAGNYQESAEHVEKQTNKTVLETVTYGQDAFLTCF